MRIETKDAQGNPNGWISPIWNVHDGPAISQVYCVGIAPGKQKGPHLHMKRRGLFYCLTGDVLLVQRTAQNQYMSLQLDTMQFAIEVPAGTPAALYNVGLEEALVVNMPEPAWRPDDQDEWTVENWSFKL